MAEFDLESLSELRVVDLQEQLSSRGLPTSGLKYDLVTRLREALKKEQNSEVSSENVSETSQEKRKLEENFKQLLTVMMEMKTGIEDGQEEMKTRIEATKKLQEKMQTNITNVINARVDVMEEKIEGLKTKSEEKFGSIDENIERMNGKFQSVEERFHTIELEIEKKVYEKLSKAYGIPQESEASTENNFRNAQHLSTVVKPCIKLSTYDGKTSWQVYKTQLAIVAEANGWDSITKARQLAASLRDEAADILRTLQKDQQVHFETLSGALELRFGEKCLKDYSRLQLKTRQQRPNESLQELATDVERLSHLAFSDWPTEVRETLALQYFVDGVRDIEIQKALRMAELKDLKSALIYSIKFESAQQASRMNRHSIRGVDVQQPTDPVLAIMTKLLEEFRDMKQKQGATLDKCGQKRNARCWKCGAEGHFQRQCQARQDQRAKNVTKVNDPEN